MSSRSNLSLGVALVVMGLLGAGVSVGFAHTRSSAPALRVCADPENLPFSDAHGEGFENRIAAVVAHDLQADIAYTWWPQMRSFLRSTLRANKCDIVLGAAPGEARVMTTAPYYCSSYVFITRRDLSPITTLDDPRLRQLKIGVPVMGLEYSSLPPVVGLARRHLVDRVQGYTLYESENAPSPWRKLVDAVAQGDVDVAVAWGPAAGYFSQQSQVPLTVTPITASATDVPMHYGVAMGVRPADTAFRQQVQQILTREQPAIHDILVQYGVPLVPMTTSATGQAVCQ